MKKILVVGIIALFMGMSVTHTIGISNNDDTTPPVTTIYFDPPEPNGNNGWYISDVNVTLNATDDISGVNVTYYRIDDGEWVIYEHFFVLSEDGEDILIEFYSVDKVGNQEIPQKVYIKIDQKLPYITMSIECIGGNVIDGSDIALTVVAEDDCSGMERVEFSLWTPSNTYFLGTFYGPGPLYECVFRYSPPKFIKGFILFKEITEEFVKFFAFFIIVSYEQPLTPHADAYDNAGNTCWVEIIPSIGGTGIGLFRNVELPNNFEGYIGRFFISAEFEEYIVESEVI